MNMQKTLVRLIYNSVSKHSPNEGFIFTKRGNSYEGICREDLFSRIFALKNYFEGMHFYVHDKFAIISENRIEWVITDIASILSGIITVPIYTSLSTESVKYILKDSKCSVCFVSNSLQLEKIVSIKNELPDLKLIISFNDLDAKHLSEDVISFNSITGKSEKLKRLDILKLLEKSLERISEDDVLTIIYTSGTTGVPKGVLLTQKNFYVNLIDCMKVLNLNEHDTFLSYLPYSHIFERTAGYYLALVTGAKIYYAQSIDTIGVQMTEVKPTIVITVPRLLDKMYNKLMKSTDEMPHGYRRRMFLWAMYVAKAYGRNKSSLKWKIADRLVFSKIRAKTGGRLKYFVSGGGALNKNIGEFFDSIGIQTLEGYGMTETSPVISVNRPGNNIYGTIGMPLDTVKVKIAEDGEILVKGELVMKGYYNDEEETKRTIIDGWLHTGDLGEWTTGKHLRITDRKKSLFKSSGGKYVAPAHIEDLMLGIHYVDQILVIGNERMYVTALIVPEYSELKNYAKKHGISFHNETELLKNSELMKLIEKDINKAQTNLSAYEKIRKFTLLEKPFTIEAGELTPTLKIKRKIVEEKYSSVIEKMYPKV